MRIRFVRSEQVRERTERGERTDSDEKLISISVHR